jgi:hypothetical protein
MISCCKQEEDGVGANPTLACTGPSNHPNMNREHGETKEKEEKEEEEVEEEEEEEEEKEKRKACAAASINTAANRSPGSQAASKGTCSWHRACVATPASDLSQIENEIDAGAVRAAV